MNKYGWISIAFFGFLVVLILLANIGSQFIWWIARFPMADKVGHFTLFGAMAFLINMALHCRTRNLMGKQVLVGSFALIILVAIEEISQHFIASRTFDITDFMYDCVGIYLGGYAAVALNYLQKDLVISWPKLIRIK